MTKAPTNGTNTNAWKEVVYNKRNKGKRTMPSKLALNKGQKEGKNEGFKSVTVKKKEMTKAMTKRSPSPKRKREPATEVIILSDDSDSKMEVDKEISEEEEVLLVDSSEDDSVLKKLPTPKKKKGRGFVNFMADFDSDNEDKDMFSEDNDLDDNEDGSKTNNEDIVKVDENTNDSNDFEEYKKEDTESEEETFWMEEETQLAIALWNDFDPKEVYHVRGRWYHNMYSGRSTLLRDPSNEFMVEAVKVNKGRKGKPLINPWQKKVRSKEPELLQLHKERTVEIKRNRAQEEKGTGQS